MSENEATKSEINSAFNQNNILNKFSIRCVLNRNGDLEITYPFQSCYTDTPYDEQIVLKDTIKNYAGGGTYFIY